MFRQLRINETDKLLPALCSTSILWGVFTWQSELNMVFRVIWRLSFSIVFLSQDMATWCKRNVRRLNMVTKDSVFWKPRYRRYRYLTNKMISCKGDWYLDRQSWSVCNSSSNHLKNHRIKISWIRTRAIELEQFWRWTNVWKEI